MAEYIERAALLAAYDRQHEGEPGRARKLIEEAPSADVAPVRHAEWFVSIGKDGKSVGTICPICGFAWSERIDAVKLVPGLSLIETPYCPNCGAYMMDGEA